jgi:2-iminobutanoate/2-iminopropanoate deaminase
MFRPDPSPTVTGMSKPLGPYTPVVRAGDFIYVSGQGGLDDGVKVAGGVVPETIQTMKNVAALLESQGASMSDVVKTTCFLTDMDDYAKFNAEYSAAFLANHRPARSCVAVKTLPAGFAVEVEAVAYKPID